MSTRTKVWFSLLVFAAGVAVYYPYSPGGRQSRNMRRAEQHIELIRPRIAADPRFARVRLGPFTADEGSLGVSGGVATQADLAALRAIIDASNPPVTVNYYVGVAETRPAERAATTRDTEVAPAAR
jgi:hypothetical protein